MFDLLLNPYGRIGRRLWWLITIGQLTLSLFWLSFNGWDVQDPLKFPDMNLSANLVAYSMTWPGWCACIKRYHDRGKSGFWVLTFFLPVFGLLSFVIELGMRRGEPTVNRFGPPPGSVTRLRHDSFDDDGAKLEKFDDDYFKNYAQEKANRVVASQSAPVVRSRPIASGPVFGKRT